MPKSRPKPTTDAGEEVLDYFDLSTAKVVLPTKEVAARKGRRATSAQQQFKRALEIAAQIEKLGSELSSILAARR